MEIYKVGFYNPFLNKDYTAYTYSEYSLNAFMSQLYNNTNIMTMANAITVCSEDTAYDSDYPDPFSIKLFQSNDGKVNTYMTDAMYNDALDISCIILNATKPSVDEWVLVYNMIQKSFAQDIYSVFIDTMVRVLPRVNPMKDVDIIKCICNVEYLISLKLEGWFE